MLPTTKVTLSRHGREQVHTRLGPKTDDEIIQMIRQSDRLSDRMKKAIRKVAHKNFFGPASDNLYLQHPQCIFVLRPTGRAEFVLLTVLWRDEYDAIAEELSIKGEL